MSTVDDKVKSPISLHGLGFIQIALPGEQRIHVWHPALPRRRCFNASQIHDHRFGFESRVLVGVQTNRVHAFTEAPDATATHIAYLHEGPRSPKGGRPWMPSGFLSHVGVISSQRVEPGETYHMLPYVFHSNDPAGDLRVATLMRKTSEGAVGARSLCEVGVEPDADFDRFQWPEHELWKIVQDVFGGNRW